MFQSVSNPLVFHARNPNATSDPNAEEVPSLTQSQFKLKKRNDRVSNTIFILIGLLVALLAVTVGFILFDKIQRDEGLIDAAKEVTREDSEVLSPIEEEDKGGICKGCISYLELKRLASESIEKAERYVNDSIAQATITPAEEAPRDLTNLTDVITRFSDLGEAKERAADLDNKIREFFNSLRNARDAENSSGDLKSRYRQRAATLERLANELVSYFANTIGIAEQREMLENEISNLRAQIDSRNVEWDLTKEQIKNRIQIIKDSLRREYEAAGVSNEADLDALIAKTLADAERCKTDAADCVKNVEGNRIKIDSYILEIAQLNEDLENIEQQISLKNWINHVLSAMAKFETVKRQLKLLQETQLRQGRENITELIQSLETRERELTRWIVEGLEKNVITQAELDLISDTSRAEEIDGNNFDAISKVSSINKAKVLRLYIKKEQDLLKAWSRQQLDTFELSQKEYNNITETIEAYNRSIQGHTEELESFRIQREEKLLRITKVTELMDELKKSVAFCEEAISKSQELYDKEAAELARLRAIKEKIREINEELAKENAELTATDKKYGKELNDLQTKINDFQNQLASLTEGRALDEAKLRRFVEEINGLIIKGPKTEEVEKKVGDAREQVRNTTDTYGEVVRLRDQVKEYLNK